MYPEKSEAGIRLCRRPVKRETEKWNRMQYSELFFLRRFSWYDLDSHKCSPVFGNVYASFSFIMA